MMMIRSAAARFHSSDACIYDEYYLYHLSCSVRMKIGVSYAGAPGISFASPCTFNRPSASLHHNDNKNTIRTAYHKLQHALIVRLLFLPTAPVVQIVVREAVPVPFEFGTAVLAQLVEAVLWEFGRCEFMCVSIE